MMESSEAKCCCLFDVTFEEENIFDVSFEDVDFPSTSNSIITLTPDDIPTRSELDNVTVRHFVGYYGGARFRY